jgi:carboxyl-terminal processing protease
LINDKPSDGKPANAGKHTLPAPDTKEDPSKLAPTEFGSKNDYQLNQALNLLKGIQILQGK